VYANCDHSYLVWTTNGHIPGCRGFAIHRKRGGQDELLDTYVGFAGQTAAPGTFKPSNVWPIQKFMWSDYMVQPGDVVQYQVVPVTGADDNHLAEQPAMASAWSPPKTVTAQTDSDTQAFFNRGVVATQWLARKLGPPQGAAQALRTIIGTVGDPTRNALGGQLLLAMQALLDEAAQGSNQLFCVLFELNDPQLMKGLTRLGKRANVVLANGSVQPPQTDENQQGRQALRAAGVAVYDRMVPKGTLAHNKFAVICDANGNPYKAWSGSTNWTETGLCTQSNNGILFKQPDMAKFYLDQFNRLKSAGNAFPPALVTANDSVKSTDYDSARASIWFSRVKSLVDLNDAKTYIDAAKQGVLFLMFNPGPAGTLLNFIVNRNDPKSATYDPHLYTHGVLNQDPSTTKNPVHLFNRGQDNPADFEVVLPANVSQQLDYWIQEILKLPTAHALVHSKTIVIDAFGAKPVVMTGSHNMGPRASGFNDDNLIIIENDPALAEAYAVYIMGVFDQYWWRFRTKQSGQVQWNGLVDNDTWQDPYFSGAKLDELKFWMGQD
jgi:phosphatidylserine/phosphatidylglycerophosphate/cardiolipin synthase-like enzyme